jgi:hypothetical protein
MTGRSGVRARFLCASTSASGTSARRSSSSRASIFLTSCEVRKPSKKWRKGTRDSRVAAWAIAARSWASCTEPEARRAKPICRQAMTSE